MKTRSYTFKSSTALALLTLSLLGAQACGDDAEPEKPTGAAGKSSGGAAGAAPKPSEDAGSGGTGNDSPDSEAGSGPGPEAGSGGGGGDDSSGPPPGNGSGGDDGTGDDDCFKNPKKTDDSIEFLNRCPRRGVSCSPFDNASRIPGFTGKLPNL